MNYPTLSESGRALLQFMQEHPAAPRYRNQSGNRLTAADLETVRAFEREVEQAVVDRASTEHPSWLEDFVERCVRDVPYYRRRDEQPRPLLEIPRLERAELARDVAQFVPDDVPVERLIMFQTSGTTGHPLIVASHPIVAAHYLAYHKRALRRFGIELRHGRGQVGVVLLGYQRACFTYVSVTPTMGESGLAKINLHPDDWRAASDREAYLDALAPEVIAGDPLSFAELLRLPLTCRPRALLSTSMALSEGMTRALSTRFGCPVLDLYSMNEAGPIAVRDDAKGGHVLLQSRMHVEILDEAGVPCPSGVAGEITLSGGFNFCVPLLRYRTGDQASLAFVDGEPVLRGLSGRPPVRFRTRAGDWLNNVDVTHALQHFAIAQLTLHQAQSGALRLRFLGDAADAAAISDALAQLFGSDQPRDVECVPSFEGKVIQYTSDLAADDA